MWKPKLLWLGCALFALPLLAHGYAGTASRYFGDDFCAGAVFRDYGTIGGQKWFYLNWGAVPTTLFLMALTDPAGAGLTRVLPAIAIVLWVAAGAWTVRQVTERIGNRLNAGASLLMAEIVVYATVSDSPNVIQSLYLRVPMFEYVGPLMALTLYAGLLARTSARMATTRWLIASGMMTFVAGSFGPVYVALQTMAVALALVVNRLLDRSNRGRTLERLLVVGLVGSIAALGFVALAPGNAMRQHSFPTPPSPLAIIKWSVLSAVFMFARPLLPLLRGTIATIVPRVLGLNPDWLPKALGMATSPLTIVLLVGVPAWLALTRRDEPAPDGRLAGFVLAGAPVLAFVLMTACMAPSAYGTSAPPPPRALIIPQFALACLTACWGYAIGVRARPGSSAGAKGWPVRLTLAAVLSVAVWAPIVSARATFREGSRLRTWAARWDDTDRQLRDQHARGQRHAVVPAVDTIGGVGSVGADAADWVNWCAARYYGFDTITGVARR